MLTTRNQASRLRIIGAASGLGAQDQRCADGPTAFHRSQAWHELAHLPAVDWGINLFPPDIAGSSSLQRIAGLCRHLAEEVELTLEAGDFPLVLGGDHSIAIGTWSGVARSAGRPPGLLWIDAHLDSHTPETSYSGALHGMPLAALLGRGDKRLLNLGLLGAQIDPARSVVLGARSYEPEEMAFLQHMGVRVIGTDELLQRGFEACCDDALAIAAHGEGGFGVTLDLDAIDPRLASGVGSPEPDGLPASDILLALQRVAAMPGLLALEIAEYNPDRDRYGETAELIAEMIKTLVAGLERSGLRVR